MALPSSRTWFFVLVFGSLVLAIGVGVDQALLGQAGLTGHQVVPPRSPGSGVGVAAADVVQNHEANTESAQADVVSLPAEATPRPDRDAQIGSEGYGPWIDRALQQGDPELSLAALQWLAACETNETLLRLVERQRGSASSPPELIQATLESALRDQRRCQTVREDQLKTAGLRLSEIALQAGLPGAAVAYMNQHLVSLPADQHSRLRQLLARDARAGDLNALAMIDASGPRIGVSAYDQAVFAAASDILGGRGGLKALWRQAFAVLAQDLPADQAQAARTEGEALARRINARRQAPSGP